MPRMSFVVRELSSPKKVRGRDDRTGVGLGGRSTVFEHQALSADFAGGIPAETCEEPVQCPNGWEFKPGKAWKIQINGVSANTEE